jgi:NADPH2:quinone reductase
LTPADRRACIDALTELLAAGRLKHTIGARFPLADVAAAHEAVEGGRLIGNVVVDVA